MALSQEQVASAYERFGHLVLRHCRAILRDEEEAMDAMQDVFVRLMKYGDGFLKADTPVRWLYRVADRVCFDFLKARKRWPQADEKRVTNAASPKSPQRALADRDLVMKFLDRFDDGLKHIAILYYVEGLSQATIALQLGMSRQTVNKKLGRLLDRAASLKRTLGAG